MENEESQLSRLFPTISISPILLRRFAPVTRYLTTRGPVPDTGNQQFTVQIEEKHIPPPQMLRLHRRSYARLMENRSMTYTYNRLKDDEIRVILLEEASFSDDIVIRLEVRKCTAVHRYEAVSYAWGHGQETGVIKVESGRSGRESREGGTSSTYGRRISTGGLHSGVVGTHEGNTAVQLGSGLALQEQHKNLYFTRRWVIQELSLSRKILLLDRHSEIDFRVLQEASEFILNHIHHLDRVKDWRLLNALHLMHILRELDSEPTGVRTTCVHDFLRLLVSAHIYDCENGLDRIYALGALEKAKRIPDYNAKVEQLSSKTLQKRNANEAWKRSTAVALSLTLIRPKRRKEPLCLPGFRIGGLHFRPKFPWHVNSNTLVVRGALIGEVKSAECISTVGGLLKFYSRSQAGEDVNLLTRTLTLDAVRDGEIARSWLKVYRDSNGEICPLENHKFNCDHLDSEAL
ncbi:hypothetical protein EKO04_008665 [Ascochyta lentis]|uniref:Heterokaryon incompatibility domain-containing protein n=1 Tax=Ascochyta lentis TaxID=205686 RepID=A0A8H7IV43_9PLEO|nr:hypothetical protein EKO04_008665 [Ascochyta lentis]